MDNKPPDVKATKQVIRTPVDGAFYFKPVFFFESGALMPITVESAAWYIIGGYELVIRHEGGQLVLEAKKSQPTGEDS